MLGESQNVPVIPQNQESLSSILERAFQLVDRSKQEEKFQNKQQQFNFLTQALDLFFLVYNRETESDLKKDVQKYLLEYTNLAERLKKELSIPQNQSNLNHTYNFNMQPINPNYHSPNPPQNPNQQSPNPPQKQFFGSQRESKFFIFYPFHLILLKSATIRNIWKKVISSKRW